MKWINVCLVVSAVVACGDLGDNDSEGPSILTAQEQLELKLESQKGPVEVVVIDRVEHPSAN